MAKIGFDLRRFTFEQGMEALQRAYAVARNALLDELHRVEQLLSEYEKTGEFIGDVCDDDVIWEQGSEYQYEIDGLNHSLSDLANNFAISYYHHWERSVIYWYGDEFLTKNSKLQSKKYGNSWHKFLEGECHNINIKTDEKLSVCASIANYLKHDEHRTKWADEVSKAGPPYLEKVPFFKIGSYQKYHVSHDTLSEIYDIIYRSCRRIEG